MLKSTSGKNVPMKHTPSVFLIALVICTACRSSPQEDPSLRCGPELALTEVMVIDGREAFESGGESAMLELARKQVGDFSLLTDQPFKVDSRLFISSDYPTVGSRISEGLQQAGANQGCDMAILSESFAVGSAESGRQTRIRFYLAQRRNSPSP